MTTAEQDRKKGLFALKCYYDAIEQFLITEGHFLRFDQFVGLIENRRGGKAFISGLGLGIALNEMPDAKVREAMNTLAVKLYWQIPSSNTLFTDAINNRLQRYDADFFKNVAVVSLEDAAGLALDTSAKLAGGVLSTIFKNKNMLILTAIGLTGVIGYFTIGSKMKKSLMKAVRGK